MYLMKILDSLRNEATVDLYDTEPQPLRDESFVDTKRAQKFVDRCSICSQ